MTQKVPRVVSAMSAIPKTNNKIQLINHLSHPQGGVNVLASDTSVVYSTIDDAVKLMKPGGYIAKVDLKSAYRSVPISANCYEFFLGFWKVM